MSEATPPIKTYAQAGRDMLESLPQYKGILLIAIKSDGCLDLLHAQHDGAASVSHDRLLRELRDFIQYNPAFRADD